MAALKIEGRYGFIDKTGRVAIEPRYESAAEFRDGLAAAGSRGRPVSSTRSHGHPPQFIRGDSFDSGIARVTKVRVWGYIRRDGTFL
jgi:hypothetical protein